MLYILVWVDICLVVVVVEEIPIPLSTLHDMMNATTFFFGIFSTLSCVHCVSHVHVLDSDVMTRACVRQ